MASSTPASRSGSPRGGGGGGPGSGSGSGVSVSLTPLSPAAPSTSTAAAGTVFSALPLCLIPEAFTGRGDFEDYLQQFPTAAQRSGWHTATTDNRPNYFALRLKGNALHFYTTLTVAQQQNFDQLVAAFRTTYTRNVEVLKAKLKPARQQPNQTIAAFLCDIQILARRVFRGQPLIEEQMVLTSFIEGLHDSQLRWELRKSKQASPDAALALAVELHAFMEMDPSLRSGSQAAVNMVSATPPQPLMATASTSSQEDMMGTLIQTIRQKLQKTLPQTNQNFSNSCSSSADGRSVRFNSPGPNRQSAITNQNQNHRNSNNNSNRYHNNNQNKRYNNSGNRQNNRLTNNRNTSNQQQNRNNTNQPPCGHCNRTNHQSRDCRACFNCGRLGHMSRECRAPRQIQNNRQQNSNDNQNSRNFKQDRNANSSQQQNTLN